MQPQFLYFLQGKASFAPNVSPLHRDGMHEKSLWIPRAASFHRITDDKIIFKIPIVVLDFADLYLAADLTQLQAFDSEFPA